jgi:hypothetical protein
VSEESALAQVQLVTKTVTRTVTEEVPFIQLLLTPAQAAAVAAVVGSVIGTRPASFCESANEVFYPLYDLIETGETSLYRQFVDSITHFLIISD